MQNVSVRVCIEREKRGMGRGSGRKRTQKLKQVTKEESFENQGSSASTALTNNLDIVYFQMLVH